MIQRFALFDPNLTCRIMISARHVPLKTLSVRTVQESAASAPVSDLIQAASIAHAARRDLAPVGSQQLCARLSLQSNQLILRLQTRLSTSSASRNSARQDDDERARVLSHCVVDNFGFANLRR